MKNLKIIGTSFLVLGIWTVICMAMRPVSNVIYIDDYGNSSTGNGIVNDYTAMQNAINAANTLAHSIGDIVEVQATPGKTYKPGTKLTLKDSVIFNGMGATLKTDSSIGLAQGVVVMSIGPGANPDTTHATPVINENAYTFTIPSSVASNLKVGRNTIIRGPVHNQVGGDVYYKGWYGKVLSTTTTGSTTIVAMSHPAPSSFTAIDILQYITHNNVSIENWEIDCTDRTSGKAIQLDETDNVSITNVHVFGVEHEGKTGAMGQGIWVAGINVTVDGCTVEGGQLEGLGGSYAIVPTGQDVTIKNCFVQRWGSGIVGGGKGVSVNGVTIASMYQTKTMAAINNTIYRSTATGSIVNFHGGGGGLIQGNHIHSSLSSTDNITVRFDNTTVIDNDITIDCSITAYNKTTPSAGYGVRIFENALKNIIVRNNKVTYVNTNAFLNLNLKAYYLAGINDTIDGAPAVVHDVDISANDGNIVYMAGMRLGANVNVSDNWLSAPIGYPYIALLPTNSGYQYTIKNNVGKTLATASTLSNTKFVQTNTQTPGAGCVISGNQVYDLNTGYASPTWAGLTSVGSTTNVTQSGNTAYAYTVTLPTWATIPVVQPLPSTPAAPIIGLPTYNAVPMVLVASTNSIYYNLYRSNQANGTYALVDTGLSAGPYTDFTVNPSATYYYKALGVNAVGQSTLSVASSATTTSAPPTQVPAAPPAPVIAGIGTSTITVLVQGNGSDSYNIYRSESDPNGTYTLVASNQSSGAYFDKNLKENTTYYYKTSGTNAIGEGAQSDPSNATTTLTITFHTRNPYKKI